MKINKLLFGIALFASYATLAQIPKDGLIAEYLFENNLNDTKSTGTPYNLSIIQGDTSYFSGTGTTGKALFLDGATKINNTDQNFVTFINNKNPWTINFWFKYKTGLKPVIMGADALISVDGNGSPYKRIWIQTGEYLGCQTANNNHGGNIDLISTNKINDDKWYFASISQDGDSTRMYIDNVLQMGKASMNLGTEPIEAFVLGSVSQSDWASRDFYIGYLDQIRVYNRALSNDEMKSLYFENKCIETVYDTTHVMVFDTIPVNPNIPSNGLVVYYPFNGNANDESGNGNNGTVTGPVLTSDRFGNLNCAYSFDGTNDYISANPVLPISNQDRSISVWFNTTSASGSNGWYVNTMTSWGSPSNNNLCAVAVYRAKLMFGAFETPNDVYTEQTVNDSIWHHAVMTYNDSILKIYLDKLEVASESRNLNTGSSSFYIGRRVGQDNQFMDGLIDDVRIYNRALTSEEVDLLYNEGKCFETVYDTIHVQVTDTVKIYKEVTVTDTLVIDVLLTGVQPPDDINTLKVYPNPAKDYLIINTGNYSEMPYYSIKIVNELGATVYETQITQPSYEINLSSWTGKGIYVLQVYDSNNVIKAVKKIILQ